MLTPKLPFMVMIRPRAITTDGRTGAQRNQEVRNLAAANAGALQQIGHRAGHHDADGRSDNAKDQAVFQAVRSSPSRREDGLSTG